MTGTGSAIVNTPAIAHNDPTILPQTPTGLEKIERFQYFIAECYQDPVGEDVLSIRHV